MNDNKDNLSEFLRDFSEIKDAKRKIFLEPRDEVATLRFGNGETIEFKKEVKKSVLLVEEGDKLQAPDANLLGVLEDETGLRAAVLFPNEAALATAIAGDKQESVATHCGNIRRNLLDTKLFSHEEVALLYYYFLQRHAAELSVGARHHCLVLGGMVPVIKDLGLKDPPYLGGYGEKGGQPSKEPGVAGPPGGAPAGPPEVIFAQVESFLNEFFAAWSTQQKAYVASEAGSKARTDARRLFTSYFVVDTTPMKRASTSSLSLHDDLASGETAAEMLLAAARLARFGCYIRSEPKRRGGGLEAEAIVRLLDGQKKIIVNMGFGLPVDQPKAKWRTIQIYFERPSEQRLENAKKEKCSERRDEDPFEPWKDLEQSIAQK